jgi:hypothetical protein
MKFKVQKFVVAISVAWCSLAIARGEVGKLPGDVDKWLRSHVESLRSPDDLALSYYPQFNSTARGEINGRQAVAVIATLEGVSGGVSWDRKLFVFWQSGDRHVYCCSMTVGGKGDRFDEDIAISANAIIISGKTTLPTDPLCCPSQPYVDHFSVVKSKLVKAATNR